SGWQQPMAAGLSEEQLTAQFLASSENYGQHGATAEAWLTGLYQDVFHRGPDALGFFLWNHDLQQGLSRDTVAWAFVTSQEANTRFVEASYQQLLGRDPEPAGETAWVSALGGGLTHGELTVKVVGSPEYVQNHASTAPDESRPAGGASSLHFQFGSARSRVAPGDTRAPPVPSHPARGDGWEN